MERCHSVICLVWLLTKFSMAQEDNSIRLVGGDCSAEGQVEIYHNGTWGTICQAELGRTEANVICRSLPANFEGGYLIQRDPIGESPVWLTSIMCSASDHSVSQCLAGLANWGAGNCEDDGKLTWVRCTKEGYDDASCSEHNPDEEGELKIDGDCHWQGQLMVAMESQWGGVCASDFDDRDAEVACRQLKFTTGWSYDPLVAGQVDSQTVISSVMVAVNCSGSEQHLSDCEHKQALKCTDGLLAGVLCASSIESRITCDNTSVIHSEGSLQLLGGGGHHEGILQAFHHGHWGNVCGTGSNGDQPKVLCEKLGYTHGQFINGMFPVDPAVRQLMYNCRTDPLTSLPDCQVSVAPNYYRCTNIWLSCSSTGPPVTPHPCHSDSCMNGGNCSADREGQTHCHCPANYIGSYCQNSSIQVCTSNPCENNGKCLVVSHSYICHCTAGYAGHLCQIENPPTPAHHTMTTVAIVLGVLFVLLLLVVTGLTFWLVRGKYLRSRRFPGMQRLDEEMSVISDQQEELGDEDNPYN